MDKVAAWVQGPIDAHAQQLIETHSQTYFVALTLISFAASFALGSVILALEVFLAGLVLLLLATVPPWPYLNRHAVHFRKPRKTTSWTF